MRKNIIMVVNPISGDVDKSELTEAALFFAEKENLNLVIYNTSGVNDIINIKTLYKTYKPERIIVAGGDGTIKMVAEAMETHDVIIGILPAGSANGLAVDLNLPSTIEENLEIAFHNDYMEIDMISINGKKSIHLSDLGVNAELIKNGFAMVLTIPPNVKFADEFVRLQQEASENNRGLWKSQN